MKTITLSNGVKMPAFGLGTFRAKGQEATNAVEHAIKVGYTMIDTAKVYENEAALLSLELGHLLFNLFDRFELWIYRCFNIFDLE